MRINKLLNKLLLFTYFSLLAISCKDNPVAVNHNELIFGIWNRVEPSLDNLNHRVGSSGITILKLFFDSTYAAQYDAIKTSSGNFKITKEVIPFFSRDSINILRLIDKENTLNNITFGIISLSQNSMVIHRYATDSVNEVFIKSSSEYQLEIKKIILLKNT